MLANAPRCYTPHIAPAFSTDWLTPHLPIWEEHLSPYRGRPGLRFLEIGTFEGRATCWLLENVLTDPSSRLFAIDPFKPFYLTHWKHGFPGKAGYPPPVTIRFEERFDANMEEADAGERLVKMKGASAELLRTLPLASFDFAFVDGSHAPADVLRDAVEAWDLLKEGGILAFDDYLLHSFTEPYRSPRMAIDAFMAVTQGRYRTLTTGWQIWLRKTMPAPEPGERVALDLGGSDEPRRVMNGWAASAQDFLSRLWREGQ
jgi:SAM-dependent methyltransferase